MGIVSSRARLCGPVEAWVGDFGGFVFVFELCVEAWLGGGGGGKGLRVGWFAGWMFFEAEMWRAGGLLGLLFFTR